MTSVQARAANLYYENSSLQEQHASKLLSIVEIPTGGLVLDLGCGTGNLAAILSNLVGPEGRVVAVDPDVERIKLAKSKNAKANIEYIVANDQSFPRDEYDLIVSNHVIHWITNKDALFERAYYNLTVGGKFAFVTFDGLPLHPPTVSRAFKDLVSPDFERQLLHLKMTFENADVYSKMALSSNFKVASVDTVLSRFQWNSLDDFLNFWSGVSHGDLDSGSIDPNTLKNSRNIMRSSFFLKLFHFIPCPWF